MQKIQHLFFPLNLRPLRIESRAGQALRPLAHTRMGAP
jgi:hypothetical protein